MEWRVDYFEGLHDTEKVKEMLPEPKILVGNLPILFTCRTKEQGDTGYTHSRGTVLPDVELNWRKASTTGGW